MLLSAAVKLGRIVLSCDDVYPCSRRPGAQLMQAVPTNWPPCVPSHGGVHWV